MTNTRTRPTYLQVDLPRLRQNLINIRKHVYPAKVMVLMKANAYGHGVDGVAPYLAPLVDYMGVAIVDEGVHLRRIGITTPIMVLGGTLPGELPQFVEHDLTVSVSSMELLDAAEKAARSSQAALKVHLKIDTGMERMGVHDYEAEAFLERSLKCRNLEIEGIYTHLANSETRDLAHARLQLSRFHEVMAYYARKGAAPPPLRHVANSGAILQLPDSHLDMVRAGVMFYGVYPGPEVQRTVEVSPALTWFTQVVHSKITLPGRPVSYGSLWSPERPVRVITIPCGYGDGYFRRMSNQARVIVRGKVYDQVGRICMDQFMANALDDDVKVGDAVVLLGRDPSGAQITAEDLAAWAGTNEYEVMTNISARVPRRFITNSGAAP
ncbi:MAG: alanine racemase [Chloroflexota bacterium]